MNIKMLSQEVIDGNLNLDESFMDIDPKFVKLKNVNGNVYLRGKCTEIPEWLKNVKIEGNFRCAFNFLKTLKNCPQNIGGYFDCSNNELTTMKNCPRNIGGSFGCSYNKLTSLEGCPESIGGDFYCLNNKVKLQLPENVKLKGEFKN